VRQRNTKLQTPNVKELQKSKLPLRFSIARVLAAKYWNPFEVWNLWFEVFPKPCALLRVS
jgi:hypothetical protein